MRLYRYRTAMSFARLLDRLVPTDTGMHLASIEGWMQGRTLYGGAASLIAYESARRVTDDLPPLRAAQVDFIAPITAALDASASVLRAGRNVVQVESRIHCEGRLAQRATWIFGRAAEAPNALNPVHPLAIAQPPEQAEPISDSPHAPQFSGQFDMRKSSLGAETIAVRRWVRNRDPGIIDPVGEAIGCGDAMPAGSLKAMQRPGPISSMNWSFVVADSQPQTRDGWWLVESASIVADHGYSGERLNLWNADGQLVLSGMQSVAIFG